MKSLNGILYLLKVGAEVSDPTKAMVEIATDARRFGVHMIEVEPNFGQGMWVAPFQPILTKIWAKGGATVQESEWAKGQKETRVIDTLEPVLTQHRLVVAESFLREDVATEDRNYSFLYRLTHITKDHGATNDALRLSVSAGPFVNKAVPEPIRTEGAGALPSPTSPATAGRSRTMTA